MAESAVLGKLGPDIVVFDLTPGQLGDVFPFLRTHIQGSSEWKPGH